MTEAEWKHRFSVKYSELTGLKYGTDTANDVWHVFSLMDYSKWENLPGWVRWQDDPEGIAIQYSNGLSHA